MTVLEKLWVIVTPVETDKFDRTKLFDLVREGVKAKQEVFYERERCAIIAESCATGKDAAESIRNGVNDKKSAGQIAYEAYADFIDAHTADGAECTPRDHAKAWELAAQSVISGCRSGVFRP